jgi:hypothetical protein
MQMPLKNFLRGGQEMETLFETSAIYSLGQNRRRVCFHARGGENFRHLHAGLDFLVTFSAMEKVTID